MDREKNTNVIECLDTTNKEVDILQLGLITISLKLKTKRLGLSELVSGMYLEFVLVILLSCNNVQLPDKKSCKLN